MTLLINGNALRIPLADKSVQCVVTSPPYWGLRDYGTAEWTGGDPKCTHEVGRFQYSVSEKQKSNSGSSGHQAKDVCPHCGATRTDKQLGLEETPEEYVKNMVSVFREVKRILRDDGVLWLNLGDSYSGSGKGPAGNLSKEYQHMEHKHSGIVPSNLKPKDLVGIPWRVAFALQADGWYLRQDIIWQKPNPMPESVKDRCTKSHEYIFLLTKSRQYYYDHEAIKEDCSPDNVLNFESRKTMDNKGTHGGTRGDLGRSRENYMPADRKRNKRSVWNIATRPYSGAHYAVFPPELPELCIKAGTSKAGKCPECGDPFSRIQEVVSRPDRDNQEVRDGMVGVIPGRDHSGRMNSKDMESIVYGNSSWHPSCECGKDPVPCVVFDPFAGSGTTVMVARNLGRHGVGTDLSFDYLSNNARERLHLNKLDEWQHGKEVAETNLEGLPLFGNSEQIKKDHKNMHRDNPHSFHKARLETPDL